MMDQKAVARVFEQIASFMELKGENTFRVRAFTTAARALAAFPGDLKPALEDGSLASTKGIGPATLQIVTELLTIGRSSLLEELREQVPPGLVEMLQVSGLGVAKIRQIHDALGHRFASRARGGGPGRPAGQAAPVRRPRPPKTS